ncbi:DUF4012 domain-containing protein [Aeromicrobium sp. CTD01-1L150]|uniref:DUF4012 domain-containing protein n=1 Tax=Aeromicrobium sp. CTD01-1L150 TaxID=3341830 RepID=UPI0035C1DE15
MRPDLTAREWRRRWWLLVAGTLLVLLAVLFLWQLGRAAVALDRAGHAASVLTTQVAHGDVDGAEATLDQLSDDTDTARRRTDGLGWAVLARLPVVGDDVDAIRTVSRELDRVVVQALPAVVEVADEIQLDTFSPQDGRIDLAAVERTLPVVVRTREVLEQAGVEIAAIEPDALFGRLRVPIRDVQRSMASARLAASAAQAAGDLLPTMLGGEGKRRYLLLIQNNAEVRSLGGIPGSFAVVNVNKGRMSMGRQGSALDVRQVEDPAVEMTDGERSVFPDTLVRDLRNTTFSPDFPRAAEIAKALTDDALDTSFDGVVSVDPGTLAHLLEGLGPVTLDTGLELTADNVVEELLNGTYRRHADDLAAQDDVFVDAARRIFDAFVAGEGHVQTVLEGLVRASTENRVLLWSAHEEEQERISTTGVAGIPPGGEDAPRVGLFLNDAAGGKMQYYLQTTHQLRSVRCLDEDQQELTLQTHLRSTAPQGDLPLPITGINPDVERGHQRLNVRVIAPEGGRIESLALDGDPQLVVGGDLDGRQVAIVPVTLEPGDSVALTATMLSSTGQPGRAVLTTTPGIEPAANDVRAASACR